MVSLVSNWKNIKGGGGPGAGLPSVGGLGGKKKVPGRVAAPGKKPRGPGSRATARTLGSKKARLPGRAGIAPPPASRPVAPPPPGSTIPAGTGGTVAPPGAGRLAGGAGLGTAFAAMEAIPRMTAELREIAEDETLTSRERGEARGGAVGDAAGSIAGAAGGAVAGGIFASMATAALVGTKVGTAVPGLGNVVGLLVGAGVGAAGYFLGGRAGRAMGAGIGGAAAGGDRPATEPYDDPGITRPGISRTTRYRADDPATIDGTETRSGIGTWDGGRAERSDGGIAAQVTPHANQVAASPGISRAIPVNDLIVTPAGTFSTHPDDYIMAMKRPTDLLGDGIRDEVRTVEHVIRETPPVTVDGEIVLRSELVIDDREYRLRQSVGKNTTPYRFAVGSATDARTVQ